MVRKALSAGAAKIVAAAIVDALLLGAPMPPAAETASLDSDVQKRLVDYRKCEALFHSLLAEPHAASDEERAIYDRRVGIERAIACAFPRGDAAKVAAGYALDVDFDREAEFVDMLLRDLPVKWLEPYLNLAAGRVKLCAGGTDSGRRQLTAARNGGNAIVRAAAEYLLTTSAPPCSPSP